MPPGIDGRQYLEYIIGTGQPVPINLRKDSAMKLRTNFISINGTNYAIPVGMTDKEVSAVCSLLLHFRRIEEIYPSDYKGSFKYVDDENVMIRLGGCDTYSTEESARAARDARNAELAAAKTEA
jgi:hypothetical protein